MSTATGIVIRSYERNAVWYNELRPLIKLHGVITTPDQIRWLAHEFLMEFGNCLDVNLKKALEEWEVWSSENDPDELHRKIFVKLVEKFFRADDIES